jgi:lipoprotein NlpD
MTGGAFLLSFSRIVIFRKLVKILLIGAVVFACSGCHVRNERSQGIYHRVKSGETLTMIARAYHVNLQDLAEINNISRPDQIETGSVVYIPGAIQVLDDVLAASRLQNAEEGPTVTDIPPVKTDQATSSETARKESLKKEKVTEAAKRKERVPPEAKIDDRAALLRAAERDKIARGTPEKRESVEESLPAKKKEDEVHVGEIQFERKLFVWPVNGKVVAKFGTESVMANYNGKKVETAKIMNGGIKIAIAAGTAVVAAAAGKVIYSMSLERFGNTIIIEHDNEFKTVYYDLGKRVVETLQHVKKGQLIAYVGEGKTVKHESFINFEIRHKNKPRNPLFFLP